MQTRTVDLAWLDTATRTRLTRHVERALARVRSGRGSRGAAPVIASVITTSPTRLDPPAVAAASRRSGEASFWLENASERYSVATLGSVLEMCAAGSGRFSQIAERWREIVRHAVADSPVGSGISACAGLTAFGGFAFAPEMRSPEWAGFGAASMTVPELVISSTGEVSCITLNAAVSADDSATEVVARLEARFAELRLAPLPLLDPAPTGVYRVHSSLAPSHHEEAVVRAVARIKAGELEKVVLAREVRVDAPRDYDPAAVFGALRDGFDECFVYAVTRGDATFIGATPELLIRRQGQRASTVALAGSTRRSADPSVDEHLAEQLLRSSKDREENAIVARRIAAVLAPYSVWVAAAPEPVVIKVANIQHLAAPIRAQLAAPISVLELAGLLHPTPAVGGEPSAVAQRLIPALEGFDRGWYAGAIGWVDAAEDGEFCVGLRCALLRGSTAACFAGGGIVADSDPAAELAETEVKLQALLPVLAG